MKPLPSCTDYIASIETQQLITANELQGGHVVQKNGKTLRYAGGFCVVFPFILSSGKKVAVRCWTANVPDADKRSQIIAQRLRDSNLPYFVGFNYIERGIATSLGLFPVVIMDWVDAYPLKEYLKRHIREGSSLQNLAFEFYNMVINLHKLGFSHGDLQHGNIMVSESGKIFLVDYDSMFVPGLEGVSDDIKGLAGYQHPGRNKNKELSPKSDYFSELVIYTSILALSKIPSLWTELNIENSETLIISPDDIDMPHNSNIIRRLKSSNSELIHCADAIEKFLSIQNIEELQPLEEVIIPESTRIIEGLQSKWKRPISQTITESVIDTETLSNKWNTSQIAINENISVNIDSITNKWRK